MISLKALKSLFIKDKQYYVYGSKRGYNCSQPDMAVGHTLSTNCINDIKITAKRVVINRAINCTIISDDVNIDIVENCIIICKRCNIKSYDDRTYIKSETKLRG